MSEIDKKIMYKAVIKGFLVDTVGSLLSGFVFGFCYAIYLARHKVPQAEMLTELQSGYLTLIFGLVVGFAFTVLGGYVAGINARKNHVLHGGIVGGLGVLVGFVMLKLTDVPMWYSVISSALVIPFGMVGGIIAKNRQRENVA